MKTVADLIMNSSRFQIDTPWDKPSIHPPRTEHSSYKCISITHRHWTTQGARTSSSYLQLVLGSRLMESILPCDDLLGTSSRSVAQHFCAWRCLQHLAGKLPLTEVIQQAWKLLGL